jgi:hypothetical protein
LRLVLVDCPAGAQYVHAHKIACRPATGVLYFPGTVFLLKPAAVWISRAVSRPIRPLFVLVSTVTSVCVLLSNSLNAWPVSCLACRPPALAYISRLSRPESRPPQDRSAVASCSFLFLFLFVIVNRERDQRVWQWLCFLDLPRPVVYIAPPLWHPPPTAYTRRVGMSSLCRSFVCLWLPPSATAKPSPRLEAPSLVVTAV